MPAKQNNEYIEFSFSVLFIYLYSNIKPEEHIFLVKISISFQVINTSNDSPSPD